MTDQTTRDFTAMEIDLKTLDIKRLLKIIATTNNPEAQFALAQAYEGGFGVPPDMEEAVFWIQRAAQQQNMYAEYGLGKCYHHGVEGVLAPNLERARKWYRKAAQQGFELALKALREMDEAAAQGSKSELTQAIGKSLSGIYLFQAHNLLAL